MMIQKLEKGERLSTAERRDLTKIIGLHMVGTLKNFVRSTAANLIEIFAKKYPGGLTVVDADGDKVNDGTEVFLIRLYDHINYKKPLSEKKSRKRKRHENENFEEKINEIIDDGSVKYDEYGCVAYEVPLPANETKISQEQRRLKIIEKRDLWKNLNEVENVQKEIGNLMNITYATQRINIIHRNVINDVLNKWPCLQDEKFFLNHATMLLGRDMKTVWNDKMELQG